MEGARWPLSLEAGGQAWDGVLHWGLPDYGGRAVAGAQTVTLPLSEYRQLVEASAQTEVLRELAWAWKTAHDTAQRQLPAVATPDDTAAVVDVRDRKRRRP